MPEISSADNDFISQITTVIQENISNEQFGVTELADRMNMSRSNLLRRVKKASNLSVSQLIREVRLKRGMELLRTTSLNVSEVSHQIGFGSTSYFIKCFREHYGYPPGEAGKHASAPEPEVLPSAIRQPWRQWMRWAVAAVIVLGGAGVWWYWHTASTTSEKSIAVLPFINESNDSTNIYLINGLMESTLTSLQQIKDLRVISRTSTERYRDATRSIPEMGAELNVRYFVAGSGQKIGSEILLNIQLIEAATDRHLWAHQYKRNATDIFTLQQEIAQNIAEEIQAIITPEEKQRLEKIPTTNLAAYDLLLKGREHLNAGRAGDLQQAINYFEQATALDSRFAAAYAGQAVAYFYLDIFKAEKKYTQQIEQNADKALLYDPKLPESLIAKALSYMSQNQSEQAIPYLERALEYNPNSAMVVGFLTDFYTNNVPNTARYLEYALKGVQLNAGSRDSMTLSYTYLRLGNALIQTGFVEESLRYIDQSLAYNPNNPFSGYVRAFVMYARNKDLQQTKDMLLAEFNKDTTRFDILQDIGKVCYFMRNYDSAYRYYQRFIRIRESRQLDVYRHENLTIGITLAKVGEVEKSREYIADYKSFIDSDRSLYRELGLAAYYSYMGDITTAITHLERYSQEGDYQYWIILFCDKDPAVEPMRKHPAYKKLVQKINDKFWKNHEAIRETLTTKGLI